MRRRAAFALAAVLITALPAVLAAPAHPAAPGSVVIVFKDGHRQAFNLADIARIEFPGGPMAESSGNMQWPARGQFVGRWIVGVGSGGDDTFVITLKEDGNAERSLHDIHGTWSYVNGEARITWDDGAQDAIRKAGSSFEKYAYHAGKSFTDEPDNVTAAHNTTPKPI
jgi:hypothetical protein